MNQTPTAAEARESLTAHVEAKGIEIYLKYGPRLGWAELVAATGVRPSAKVPLATWAWLRANRPDLWRATARCETACPPAAWRSHRTRSSLTR